MMNNKIIADYVWLDGICELRSKTRVINSENCRTFELLDWNYDGSSTHQANTENSEVILKPKSQFRCPFRKGNNVILICDTYIGDQKHPSNTRYDAVKIFEKYKDEKPWYGLEQEYYIFDKKTNLPLSHNNSHDKNKHYCSVGGNKCFGRKLSDLHLEYCLYSGIEISGTNAEVSTGQFEYQIGPVEGISAADQLIASRYILHKLTEEMDLYVSFDPKPCVWLSGSGCHTNFSTEKMRLDGGISYIKKAIDKLKLKHDYHMSIYGAGNIQRMTGNCETSDYNSFSSGVGDRTASIRIPTDTFVKKWGYFEDRRPAANCDPYLVTSSILKTIME